MLVQHAQQLQRAAIDQPVMYKVIRSGALGLRRTKNANIVTTASLSGLAAVLVPPAEKRLLRDVVLAADLLDHRPIDFCLPQHTNNLFFCESLLHCRLPLGIGLYDVMKFRPPTGHICLILRNQEGVAFFYDIETIIIGHIYPVNERLPDSSLILGKENNEK
jgi:hypothetical protein